MPTTNTTKPKAPAKPKAAKRPAKSAKGGRVTKRDSAESRLLQRPLWIAVGAVALAAEAVQDFMDESLKRGEKLEGKARKELKKRRNGTSKVAHQQKAKARKLAKQSGRLADRVLNALEIPSHRDIVTLEKKVDAIARKVA